MGGEAFGPYRLESLLGRGGMGEVWRAVDTSQGDRTVAVKVLGSWLNGDPDFTGRFRRESALAARLSGPHIVPIHRYGEIDGRLYIDMPLIVGTDLAALLTAPRPLTPARAVSIIDQVADALDTAHRAGMVHRDVKPSNVLVTARDHAYLIDFGIARALDGTRYSMSGAVIGTLAYMAPERFDGAGDHRADVYALGCLLHEVLTGQQPFTAESLLAYWKAHSSAPRPRPTALCPDLPSGLDEVVAIAMDLDPERHYPDAGSLATAARAALTVPVQNSARASPLSSPAPVSPIPVAERVLVGHTSAVCAVTTARRDGRPVIISGGGDGTLRFWDLTTGRPIGSPLTGHTRSVIALTTAQLDGRPVIISAGVDRTLRVWDITASEPIGAPLTAGHSAFHSVTATQLDGRPVIISAGSDGMRTRPRPSGAMPRIRERWRPSSTERTPDAELRVWDLATAEPIGTLPVRRYRCCEGEVTTAELDGRRVVVCLHDLLIWDLATGEPIDVPFTPRLGDAATIAQLDGRPVIVGSGVEQVLSVWDLATGEPIGKPTAGHTSRLVAVTTTVVDGRPVIISASLDGDLRLWDLATGAAIGDRLKGHSQGRNKVTATRVDGRPVIISGGADSTIRTWDLIDRMQP